MSLKRNLNHASSSRTPNFAPLFVFTKCLGRTSLDSELLSQLACHILAYADVLFNWQLLNKRLELLNTVKTSSFVRTPPQNLGMRFGAYLAVCAQFSVAHPYTDIQPACGQCGHGHMSDDVSCSMCGSHQTHPRCSVCRLPVKGTSSLPTRGSLLRCLQVSRGAVVSVCISRTSSVGEIDSRTRAVLDAVVGVVGIRRPSVRL